MKLVARSDTGEVRPSNQDFYAIGEKEDYFYAIVCDGMGGCNGGNVASQMAVAAIEQTLIDKLNGTLFDVVVKGAIEEGIREANRRIYERSLSESELRGMGTTAVVAVYANNKLYLAHVGDSRAYILKGSEYTQLTKDHSVVQELVESGQISEEEAREHPIKNVITRAIGVEKTVEIDFKELDFEIDEALLICTDGLSNYLTDDVFKSILRDNSKEEYAEKLVEYAKESGGADNITVVLMLNDEVQE